MLKFNDYWGFIREKQEKIKAKRSCYSNGSVRLIICQPYFFEYHYATSNTSLSTILKRINSGIELVIESFKTLSSFITFASATTLAG